MVANMPVKRIHLCVVAWIVLFVVLRSICHIVLNRSEVNELLTLRFILFNVEKVISLEKFFVPLCLTHKI